MEIEPKGNGNKKGKWRYGQKEYGDMPAAKRDFMAPPTRVLNIWL